MHNYIVKTFASTNRLGECFSICIIDKANVRSESFLTIIRIHTMTLFYKRKDHAKWRMPIEIKS